MARKHISQFSKEEPGWAVGFIRRQALPHVWTGTAHFYDRAADRRFTLNDAREALRTGNIVEIHNEAGEIRALVRSHLGTCVVLSLETFRLVTVYYNDPQDKHETLNHSLYHGSQSINVVQIIKQLLSKRKAA